MVGQRTQQVRRMVGIRSGSRQMALMRVMFWLALCVLVGAMAPTAVAWRGYDSTLPQRIYARQADGIWVSDDAGTNWSRAGALPSRPLSMAVAKGTSAWCSLALSLSAC